MNKKGRMIGIALMLILGVILICFAFKPPKFMIFWNGNVWRIGSGVIGAFFLLAGVMNIFHREK